MANSSFFQIGFFFPKKINSFFRITSERLTYRNTATPQHRNTATPQHRNTATPQHRNTATPQHRNTATPQHRNTATPQHRPQSHSWTSPPHNITISQLIYPSNSFNANHAISPVLKAMQSSSTSKVLVWILEVMPLAGLPVPKR